MISFEVEHSVASFNKALKEYVGVSQLTNEEALAKQGTKLAFELSNRLRGLTPGKGVIRAERLAALKSGEGVFVRPGVVKRIFEKYGAAVNLSDRTKYVNAARRNFIAGKSKKGVATIRGLSFSRTKKNPEGVRETMVEGKRLNLRALMVKAELSRRESGRGYLGFAARINTSRATLGKLILKFGRYNQQLATAGLFRSADGSYLHFKYGTPLVDVGYAYNQPRQQRIIAQSINAVVADMQVYLARKHAEAMQAAFSRVKGAVK